MDKVAIIGYSGHAYVVLDACNKNAVNVGYYCDKNKAVNNPYKLEYIGDESSDNFEWNNYQKFILGIGNNHIRTKIATLLISKNKDIETIVHPSAVINDFTEIGEGSFIASNVIINPLAKIGKYAIINTAAVVEHECIIGDGVHIAPGAVLAGNVIVGDLTFIGANSVVKQGIKIGENAIVGAGSVVLKDIPNNEKWVGNPAKKI